MKETKENNQLLLIKRKQRTRQEIEEIVEKVGNYRMLGFTFANIGKALGISEAQSFKHYNKWCEIHEKELRRFKRNFLVSTNVGYSKRLASAHRHFVKSEEEQDKVATGFWSRHIIEIMKEHEAFLARRGLLTEQDLNELTEVKSLEQKEPIVLVIEEYRKYLVEKIENNRKNTVSNVITE